MKVTVATTRLEKDLSDKRRVRVFGAQQAKKIKLRLTALLAAESLADFWPPNTGPERCHVMTADLAGLFSMDVKQPYRLLFRPVGLEDAEFANERERWQAIREVEIVGVEDTHD